jgi:cyclopropane fatty-acyl-phospholipid synthase-like methyltransferase
MEFGGANSCFVDSIVQALSPSAYHVVDTNQHGLDLLEQRRAQLSTNLITHKDDCRSVSPTVAADVTFSVGLVEHFAPEDTRKAILSHFDATRPGGWVLISFPTPTWLYRTARSVVSALGLWRFPDERPLDRDEVVRTVSERGELVFETVLWPLIFTQHLVLAKKKAV